MLNLTASEAERLLIFQAAELARRRRARGLRLNQAEAAALLLDDALEHARDGRTIPEVRELVTGTLTTDDVLPGVARLVPMLVVEGQFPDGTRLITIYDPITPGVDVQHGDGGEEPGAVITPDTDIELNAGLPVLTLDVVNTGDRAIQVSSHHPFAETNAALAFDRHAATGHRLDVPAGTTVRFEPGVETTVTLVPFPAGGAQVEPRQIEPRQVEPRRVEPGQAEPGRIEPGAERR